MAIKYLIGIDEAGRGPLAGPLAVGGVIIPYKLKIKHEYFEKGIKDSKKLTELRRTRLLEWMRKQENIKDCVAFAPSFLIDSAGITIAINKLIDGVLNKLLPEEIDETQVLVLLDGGLKAPERFVNQIQ